MKDNVIVCIEIIANLNTCALEGMEGYTILNPSIATDDDWRTFICPNRCAPNCLNYELR